MKNAKDYKTIIPYYCNYYGNYCRNQSVYKKIIHKGVFL